MFSLVLYQNISLGQLTGIKFDLVVFFETEDFDVILSINVSTYHFSLSGANHEFIVFSLFIFKWAAADSGECSVPF